MDPEIFERVLPLKPSAAELASYAGRFRSEELDATFTLAVEEGVLTLRRRGAPPQRLTPMVRDEFMAGQVTVRFVRGAGDDVTGYVLDSAGSATCGSKGADSRSQTSRHLG